MTERICAQCRYWQADTQYTTKEMPEPRIGECRRHSPPALRSTANAAYWAWPLTRDNEWCGDWKDVMRLPRIP